MFLVIYEQAGRGTRRKFKALVTCFEDYEGADEMAKQTAKAYNARAWVFECPDPPLIEKATDAEIKPFIHNHNGTYK